MIDKCPNQSCGRCAAASGRRVSDCGRSAAFCGRRVADCSWCTAICNRCAAVCGRCAAACGRRAAISGICMSIYGCFVATWVLHVVGPLTSAVTARPFVASTLLSVVIAKLTMAVRGPQLSVRCRLWLAHDCLLSPHDCQ